MCSPLSDAAPCWSTRSTTRKCLQSCVTRLDRTTLAYVFLVAQVSNALKTLIILGGNVFVLFGRHVKKRLHLNTAPYRL